MQPREPSAEDVVAMLARCYGTTARATTAFFTRTKGPSTSAVTAERKAYAEVFKLIMGRNPDESELNAIIH